ncbi:LacI family DNA-binding transcriptional regulator [Parafrigoribacterium soli]|uniref:LacI family DNA-binding transcriptional regulator n=1 Tax=Parafrigoribacterium soli TaxID=3144663 RepID=UPI0032F00F1C
MTPTGHSPITQRRIAELAGVSQSTVSLVLNGETSARIPEETRKRVLEVIRENTYVADPAARRLAGVGNKLIGVFTYEHAFPSEVSDFYAPLLTGIENGAETLGFDLLMFTSAPVIDGHRQIFHENSRLRLADGCLLLGREMDSAELERLLDTGYPFVALGRRDGADGRIPYVGLDYVTPTRDLARLALAAGHTQFFYVHFSQTAEASRDRFDSLRDALVGATLTTTESTEVALEEIWRDFRASGATILFVENPAEAETFHSLAKADGLDVPRDLSMVVLGERSSAHDQAIDFTRLSAPRDELGMRATVLLDQLLNGASGEQLPLQQLLDCVVVPGSTLAAPGVAQ